MQKLINDPDNYVDEMLDGMVSAYPERLTRVDDTKVLTRDSLIDGKVGIVEQQPGKCLPHQPLMNWIH
jgi:dihydroxyacetone kinase-like protein